MDSEDLYVFFVWQLQSKHSVIKIQCSWIIWTLSVFIISDSDDNPFDLPDSESEMNAEDGIESGRDATFKPTFSRRKLQGKLFPCSYLFVFIIFHAFSTVKFTGFAFKRNTFDITVDFFLFILSENN